MTKKQIVIATRESPLALKQTESIKIALEKKYPELNIKLLGITTVADKRLDITLQKIGGKGLFVKELETALLEGHADIAVHSMKDVPMELPAGLIIPVIGQREEYRDVFVSNLYDDFNQLPSGATIGTASVRRQAQMRALRKDVVLKDLRGNINTRLERLDKGEFDAIILAAAGLIRMDYANRIRNYFSIEQSVPAAGQGALGLECREDDQAVIDIIADLNDPTTNFCVSAERALCRRLHGGCSVPIGAYASVNGGELTLHGMVASRDGKTILHTRLCGDKYQAENIGFKAAQALLKQGAERLLREFHDA